MSVEKHRESFTVRSYETRPDGLATLPAIGNYLQEAATNNARNLNWDYKDLNVHNRMWILHRLLLKMERYPQWQESVTVETWPSGSDNIRAYRDFKIFLDKTTEIGRAVSQWMILDKGSRRPIRMPEEIEKLAQTGEPHVLPMPTTRIPDYNETEHCTPLKVHFNDLDMNRHANNVRYIEWMLRSLPNDVLMNNIPTQLDIQYKGECNAGTHIETTYQSTEYTPKHHCVVYQHQIRLKSTKAPLASACLTLKHL